MNLIILTKPLLSDARRLPACNLRTYASSLAVVMLAITTGCQQGVLLYPVEGLVQFKNGNPVRNATIELIPTQSGSLAKGPSPRGKIDREGRFTLSTFTQGDGAQAGDYKVIVVQSLAPGARAASKLLGDEHKLHASATQVVAMKHAQPNTTGIEVSVKPVEKNELSITVEKQ